MPHLVGGGRGPVRRCSSISVEHAREKRVYSESSSMMRWDRLSPWVWSWPRTLKVWSRFGS